eukprot:GHVL01026961.1.p1 GENE.GHVL01026961.1~~GHVL01026961.1.p1  ORF type:complete len:218 (+),score=30.42 GHVL01026961.1:462-1115(+)
MRAEDWLMEIVNNKSTSIDVDKWDYLQRDSFSVGLNIEFDFDRVYMMSRVENNHICFHVSVYDNLWDMFTSRWRLHKRVYSHKKTCATELMLSDAILLAEPVLRIREKLFDAAKFIKLSDWIWHQIQNSTEPELHQSRQILLRLSKRDLYKCVDELIFEPKYVEARLAVGGVTFSAEQFYAEAMSILEKREDGAKSNIEKKLSPTISFLEHSCSIFA